MSVPLRLRVPALTFHDVHPESLPPASSAQAPMRGQADPFYSINEQGMEDLLSRLRKLGYRTISSRVFRGWQRNEQTLPERPVVLTFDDGYASHFDVVTPMLVRHRFTGTFFVTTDFVGRPGYVTWEQLRKMVFLGMEIGSHGKTHRLLTQLSPEDKTFELAESKRIIESELGVPVRAIAAPGGFWSRSLAGTAQRLGYEAAWVSDIGLNKPNTFAFALKRLPVHQPLDSDRLLAMVEGRRRILWTAIARQGMISVLKAGLGVAGYEKLKRRVRQ